MSGAGAAPPSLRSGARVIFVCAAVLAVLHQDFWLWDDATLLFGFLPVGLAWHAGYSLAAAALWFTATRIMWPEHLEAWADEGDAGGGEATRAGGPRA